MIPDYGFLYATAMIAMVGVAMIIRYKYSQQRKKAKQNVKQDETKPKETK